MRLVEIPNLEKKKDPRLNHGTLYCLDQGTMRKKSAKEADNQQPVTRRENQESTVSWETKHCVSRMREGGINIIRPCNGSS